MDLGHVKTIDSYWVESISPILEKLTPLISDVGKSKFYDLNRGIYDGLMEFDFIRDKSLEFDEDKSKTVYDLMYFHPDTLARNYFNVWTNSNERLKLIIQNQTIDDKTYRSSIIKGHGFNFSLVEHVDYLDSHGKEYHVFSDEVKLNDEVLAEDIASDVRDYIASIFKLLNKVELGQVINEDNRLSHEKIITDFYKMIEIRTDDIIREFDIEDKDHVYYRLPALLSYVIDHFYRHRESYAIEYDDVEHTQTLSYQDVKIIIPADTGYIGGEVHIGDDSIRLEAGGSDEAIQRTGYFIKDEKQVLDFISDMFIYYIFELFVAVIQSIKTGHLRYRSW